MRTDHPVLIGGRRSPCCGGFCDQESADGNISDSGLIGHETVAAHGDLHLPGVGVQTEEVCIQNRLISVLLRVPFITGLFRAPGAGIRFTVQALLQCDRLIHHAVIKVDRSGMAHGRCKVPVAADIGGVGIVGSEYTVVYPQHPHIPLIGNPSFCFFGSGDHSAKRRLGAVGDPVLRRTCIARVHVFPVDARCNEHFISGFRRRGSVIDVPVWTLLRSVSLTGSIHIYVDRSSITHIILHLRH